MRSTKEEKVGKAEWAGEKVRRLGKLESQDSGGRLELIKYVYWSKKEVAPRSDRLDNSGEAVKEGEEEKEERGSSVSTIKNQLILLVGDANR